MSVSPVICAREYYYIEILEKVFMVILIIKIIYISLCYSSCNILVILIIWISSLLRQIYFYNHIISSFIHTTSIFWALPAFKVQSYALWIQWSLPFKLFTAYSAVIVRALSLQAIGDLKENNFIEVVQRATQKEIQVNTSQKQCPKWTTVEAARASVLQAQTLEPAACPGDTSGARPAGCPFPLCPCCLTWHCCNYCQHHPKSSPQSPPLSLHYWSFGSVKWWAWFVCPGLSKRQVRKMSIWHVQLL